MHVAKYGDLALLVTRHADEGDGRDWITQSPAIGDQHVLQDRGRRQRRTQCEILFCDEAGAGAYMDRFLAFRELANGATPRLFVHPIHGAYQAVVVEPSYEVVAQERCVRVTCTFTALEEPKAVFDLGAGVTAAAGPEQVAVRATAADAALADVELESTTPASCLAAVTAWAEADDPDARAIGLEAASLAAEIDEVVADLELAADLTRWEAYRSLVNLRYSVVRAAEAVTSETSRVTTYTLQVAEPLRPLCARLYGARDAEERARQVQKLNGLRTPGLIAAGTSIKLPALGAR
jgi:hypothetical protein